MADWVFQVECVGIAIVLALSVGTKLSIPAPIERVIRRAARFGRRRRLAVISVGLVAGMVAMTISLIRDPAPIGHDEQSYLLAADTFYHGRLTNPTHATWKHFESFHVIHQPTYASKYPPGQGMVLALGQVLTGRPMAGVWISTALAAAATCWMLQGWLPGRWALLGGAIVALHVAIQLAWGQSDWGGNVAMVGGALLLGSLPRLRQNPEPCAAVLMACGMVILANSRPYEGLVMSLPVALALIVRFSGKRRPPLATVARKVVLPAAIVLFVAGAAMAYYNLRITGDPLKMPYRVHEETYMVAPVFLWQSLRPEPIYRHEMMRFGYTEGPTSAFLDQQDLFGLLRYKGPRAVRYLLHFFLRPILIVPLLALPWILRKRSMWFVIAALSFAWAASLAPTWLLPHYLAPAIPLLFLLVVQGIRRLRRLTWGGRCVGGLGVSGIGVLYALILILSVCHYAASERTGIARHRPRLLAQLMRTPGRHLVVVRYAPEHTASMNDEWVYNAADIDAAKVVWAREMGPARDRELFDYFKDRRGWLLLADAQPPRLLPHPQRRRKPPRPRLSERGHFTSASP
ncbi:MAG: hypothetical protein ACYSWU_07575 [Planctomycetota bacterium]|jgi:hypothetical protein